MTFTEEKGSETLVGKEPKNVRDQAARFREDSTKMDVSAHFTTVETIVVLSPVSLGLLILGLWQLRRPTEPPRALPPPEHRPLITDGRGHDP